MQHEHLEAPSKKSVKVGKRALINTLNHAHFTGNLLWARVQGPSWNGDRLVRVRTGLCRDDEVLCQCAQQDDLNLEKVRTLHLVMEDGKRAVVIPTTINAATRDSITLKLPEQGYVLNTRKVPRVVARQVQCDIFQGETRSTGALMDFSVLGFRLGLDPAVGAPQLDTGKPVQTRMRLGDTQVFAGPCRILRIETGGPRIYLILQPLVSKPVPRGHFLAKRIRSPRLHLSPTPKVVFEHPLSNKELTYEIFDITASGFSLFEHSDETLLMPGLIIPRATLLFDNSIRIACSAQVLHSHRRGERIRTGFAIRDMDINAFIQLCDILANALDAHASMSRLKDMDALWDIFFNTGFVYSQKYEYISRFHEDFKETYRKLYQENKDIFFFFTYQESGKIYGHLSFIRAYQRLWMVHHLTARPMHGKKRIGLEVFKHLYNIIYDGVYRLPSSKIDYAMFYFRPSNSFMMFFQGGYCRKIGNPRICSMDLFAYLHMDAHADGAAIPAGWTLDSLTDEDVQPLRDFYAKRSGGLLLDALGIGMSYPDEEPLEAIYSRLGLIRQTRLFALKHAGTLKAAFIVDTSDRGVNLSDLLNCIKVMVVDQELTWEVMRSAVGLLSEVYATEQIPVLIYPEDYPKRAAGIAGERSYYLWIQDSRYAERYVAYMKKQIESNPLRLFFRAILAKRARKEGA
ncbi:MAG: PilZ domain-containing protein [Syntrophaceae bacterium]